MAVTITGSTTPAAKALSWDGSVFKNTWAATTSAGDNVLVAVLTGDGFGPSAVKWNGTALTQRKQQADGDAGSVGIWDIDSPDIGSYSLQIEKPSGATYNVCIITLSGVDVGGTPRGTAVGANAFSTTPTVTATTVVGDLVLGAASTVNTATPNGGQTTVVDDSLGGGEYMQVGYKTATGVTESVTWTQTSSRWAVAAVPYMPAASSPTLTDVDTDETIVPGQTGVVATGTNLSAGASARWVDANANVLTMTNYSASATAPTFDVPSLATTLAAGVKFGSGDFEIWSA